MRTPFFESHVRFSAISFSALTLIKSHRLPSSLLPLADCLPLYHLHRHHLLVIILQCQVKEESSSCDHSSTSSSLPGNFISFPFCSAFASVFVCFDDKFIFFYVYLLLVVDFLSQKLAFGFCLLSWLILLGFFYRSIHLSLLLLLLLLNPCIFKMFWKLTALSASSPISFFHFFSCLSSCTSPLFWF